MYPGDHEVQLARIAVQTECASLFTLRFSLKGISNAHKEDIWPGKWIAEDCWPSSSVQHQEFTLRHDKSLTATSENKEKPTANEVVTKVSVKSSHLSGAWGGLPLAFSLEELPMDQRFEDTLSECWETATLEEPVSVVGFPEAHLQMSCDRPCAVVAVRLCDVFPNGESSLMSRGKISVKHESCFALFVWICVWNPQKQLNVTLSQP